MMDCFSEYCSRNFVFCDVGARWGLEEPFKSYRDCVDVISFEPDQDEYEELSNKKMNRDLVLPYALYKEVKQINLNLTKNRGCSSIYEPNHAFLANFPDVERFNVEKNTEVQATTLDNLYINKKLKKLDFIKLDTQGAELDILKGGKNMITENIIGLQVEVEFKEIYNNQPLFAEVDLYIRKIFGLELFDIRKVYWKYKEGRGIGSSKGQLIFGAALYLRSPYELPNWCSQFGDEEARNKITMACLMGMVYGYPDYSLCILERPELLQWMNKETISGLKTIIYKYTSCNKISFWGSGKIYNIFQMLSKLFEPDHEGWATGERHLGSRKRFGIHY